MKKLSLILSLLVSFPVNLWPIEPVQTKNGINISIIGCNNPTNKIVPLQVGGLPFELNENLTVQDFTGQDIYPLAITVTNTTDKPLVLMPYSTRIPLIINKEEITKKLHHRNYIKPLLFWIGSKTIQTLIMPPIVLNKSFNMANRGMTQEEIMLTLSQDPTVILSNLFDRAALFATPVYWWYLRKLNQAIDAAIGQYLLDNNITIMPGQTIKKILACKYRPGSMLNLNFYDLSGQVAESIDLAIN